MTVRSAARRLAAAGVASPWHDARVLRDFAGSDYAELIAARAARVPLQYLVGWAGFRRLSLSVGPGVFIPRPETETVVEWCLGVLRPGDTVVDVCSGSGAIALALDDEGPADLTVYAVERERDAYSWLQRNAADTAVRCVLADAADALPGLTGQVDVVVGNPPYLRLDERALVEPEVRDHEPPSALWVDGDGLDGIRLVARAARRLLRSGGVVAVEHGDTQQELAAAVLDEFGFQHVQSHRDLTDRPRFATGVKR